MPILFRKHAFTLIELLIVVAIIAILAAIAVPNFLEAQVRSKVSRTKADMRSLATALEAYLVDNNRYPLNLVGSKATGVAQIGNCASLSTPVAYMSSTRLLDPFSPNKNIFGSAYMSGVIYFPPYTYFYQNFEQGSGWMRWQVPFTQGLDRVNMKTWYLESWGPDRVQGNMDWWILSPWVLSNPPATINELYDPTNGTMSRGDIGRLGGEAPQHVVGLLNK